MNRFTQIFLLSLFTVGLLACAREQPESPSEAPVAAFSTLQSEVFYHREPDSSTARKLTLSRNAAGQVTVTRENVPLSAAGDLVSFVGFDADSTDSATATLTYAPATTSYWFIPFNDDSALEIGDGGSAGVACHCRSARGECWTVAVPDFDGRPEIYECRDFDCNSCIAIISFLPTGPDYPAGITLRATQVTIQ